MTGRRATVWFAVFALVVFVSGLATGILIDRWVVPQGPVFPMARAMRGGPNPERLANRLTRELSLTAEQRTRVKDIFDRRREGVRRMHQELRSDARRRFQSEQAGLREELRRVLTPEQQAKFDALVNEGPERLWPGPGRWLRPAPGPE